MAWKQAVLGTCNVLFAVIAVRFSLLIAITGAVWLTLLVTADSNPFRLAAIAIYSIFVVIPTIWLASRK